VEMTSFELAVLSFVRFAILSAGLTYYITQSAIFAPLRLLIARCKPPSLLLYFLYCPACVGTWIGLILGFIGLWPWMNPVEAAIASCVINRLMPSDNVVDAELGDRNGEKAEG